MSVALCGCIAWEQIACKQAVTHKGWRFDSSQVRLLIFIVFVFVWWFSCWFCLWFFFRPAGANKRRTGKEVSEQHGNSLRISELDKQSQSQPRMPVAVINCKEHIINFSKCAKWGSEAILRRGFESELALPLAMRLSQSDSNISNSQRDLGFVLFYCLGSHFARCKSIKPVSSSCCVAVITVQAAGRSCVAMRS